MSGRFPKLDELKPYTPKGPNTFGSVGEKIEPVDAAFDETPDSFHFAEDGRDAGIDADIVGSTGTTDAARIPFRPALIILDEPTAMADTAHDVWIDILSV